VHSTWLSPRAALLHVTMVLLVATMAGLTWWQTSRALSGNTLSYVYAFEWPLLAGVVVYMWWDLLHDRPDRSRREEARPGGQARASASTNGSATAHPGPAVPRLRDEDDEALAAYNRYLAELNASGRRKTWRHPT
jgi:hypothetical protein